MEPAVPGHVAVIMDGNGRWAQKRHMPRTYGHRKGMDALRRTVRNASSMGVKILTVYAFSTENWKRPKEEVQMLMSLIGEFVRKELAELKRENVKISTIGNLSPLPRQAKDAIEAAVKQTESNSGLHLIIALNYGGRDDLVRAFQSAYLHLSSGQEMTEEMVEKHLDTAGVQDPDLLIRTGGELRISNFLLWQTAYTELCFTETLWPDFDAEDLSRAVEQYQKRARRFGGL